MKHTQYEVLGNLLKRKNGATPSELIAATMTTSLHRRLYEMRCKGWKIVRQVIPGKPYGRYIGTAPKA